MADSRSGDADVALLNALSSTCPPPRADDGSSSSSSSSSSAERWWLPCRGDEARAVDGFLRRRLSVAPGSRGPPRALYIAGKPGTGKTATVARVLERLEAFAREPGVTKGPSPRLHPFRLVRINGNHLLGNSSVSVFSEIARQTGAAGPILTALEDARAAALGQAQRYHRRPGENVRAQAKAVAPD